MGDEAPVAPELLRYIEDYIDESGMPEVFGEHLDSDSNLLVFCRELFAQLFANVIGEPITSVGQASAERANVLLNVHGDKWKSMGGFVTTGAHVRAVGIAAWAVVLSLAVSNESALMAGLAAALLGLFAYGDAFHAALYRRALARALALERVIEAYLDRLGIDADDPEAVLRARAKLETHRFGMYRSLRPLRLKDMAKARPRAVFLAVYPGLLAVTAAAAVVYAA